MDNNWFKKATDVSLDGKKASSFSVPNASLLDANVGNKSENGFRKPSVDDLKGKKDTKNDGWFKKPVDMDLSKNNLDEKAKYFAGEMVKKDVEEYIKMHTSGVRLDSSLCSRGGGRIATFSKFVEMVEDGYNIVKADLVGYVNNEYLIDVEFQLEKEKDKKTGIGGR